MRVISLDILQGSSGESSKVLMRRVLILFFVLDVVYVLFSKQKKLVVLKFSKNCYGW